jgi:hypothetical protein
MSFEEFQKAWQSQETGTTIKIDSNLLLNEVRRNKDSFEASIFWRDVREVGAALLVCAFSVYSVIKDHFWPVLLLIPGVLFVAVYLIVDRRIQKRKLPVPSETLLGYLTESLNQVNHQIRLLKNVFWWYLLPILICIVLFTTWIHWSFRGMGAFPLICSLAKSLIITIIVNVGIYYLNQWAVKADLEPRKKELEQLLDSLKGD